MARKNYTVEQNIVKLRKEELHCNQNNTISEAYRGLEITEQTYYRWQKKYWNEHQRWPPIKGIRERGCSSEEAGSRTSAGYLDPQRCELKALQSA